MQFKICSIFSHWFQYIYLALASFSLVVASPRVFCILGRTDLFCPSDPVEDSVSFAYMRTLTFPGQTKEGIILRLNEELKERGFDIVSRVDLQVILHISKSAGTFVTSASACTLMCQSAHLSVHLFLSVHVTQLCVP